MNSLKKFNQIQAFVFDVDGVLTNGNLIILPSGVMARTMNVKDGYALQLAVKKGYKVAIISGGYSEELIERFNMLGITDVFLRVSNKTEVLTTFLLQQNIAAEHTLFMGDDLPDYEVMQTIGLPCCPANAVEEIKAISSYISPINGGDGCVRDVIEKTLKLAGKWQHVTQVSSK